MRRSGRRVPLHRGDSLSRGAAGGSEQLAGNASTVAAGVSIARDLPATPSLQQGLTPADSGMAPSVALHYIIALQGTYPSRS